MLNVPVLCLSDGRFCANLVITVALLDDNVTLLLRMLFFARTWSCLYTV